MKDLLVVVDGAEGAEARLEFSLQLASRLDAVIHGLHVRPPAEIGPEVRASGIEAATAVLNDRLQVEAEQAERLFGRIMQSSKRPYSWRTLNGDIAKRVCQEARYADLVVLGQFDWQDPPERHPMPVAHSVALGSGGPVLVTPAFVDATWSLETAYVAWDGSREAVRAVHDALPLLRLAKSVVVALAEPIDPEISPARLADYLGHQGVCGVRSVAVDRDGSESQALLRTLQNGLFDLAVFGAYSHPRWLEFLAGGTTQTLLAQGRTPMLISH